MSTSIRLTKYFSEDQKKEIDAALDKLTETDNVINYARTLNAKDKTHGNILQYDILFKDADSIYLFGYRQGMKQYLAL